MEINTNNSSGMMNGLPPIKREDRKVGPIVGALVIILLIIVGTLYFFGQRLNTQDQAIDTASTENSSQLANIDSVSESLQSIDSELDEQLIDIDYSF